MKTYYEKGDVLIRDSTSEDADYLKVNLRKSDKDEIWASHHLSPDEALKRSIQEFLVCATALKAGRPVCIFGIEPETILGERATIWLLGTDDLLRYKREFLKLSKYFIEYFLEYYPILSNYIDNRNKASIRWLRWLGAKMNGTVPYGVEQKPFHYFTFARKHG